MFLKVVYTVEPINKLQTTAKEFDAFLCNMYEIRVECHKMLDETRDVFENSKSY